MAGEFKTCSSYLKRLGPVLRPFYSDLADCRTQGFINLQDGVICQNLSWTVENQNLHRVFCDIRYHRKPCNERLDQNKSI